MLVTYPSDVKVIEVPVNFLPDNSPGKIYAVGDCVKAIRLEFLRVSDRALGVFFDGAAYDALSVTCKDMDGAKSAIKDLLQKGEFVSFDALPEELPKFVVTEKNGILEFHA